MYIHVVRFPWSGPCSSRCAWLLPGSRHGGILIQALQQPWKIMGNTELYLMFMGGSKALSVSPDILTSISGIRIVEGENQLP